MAETAAPLRTRKPSPAKATIDKLREEGFINKDGAIILFKIDGTGMEEDFVEVPLNRFIGIREPLITGQPVSMDKILTVLGTLPKEDIKKLLEAAGLL